MAASEAATGARFRDLGTLVVSRGDRDTPVTGALGAALSLLLVHVGRPVSSDALGAAIWSDHASRSPSTLTSHLSRLRGVLGGGGADEPRLVRDPSGIRLVVGGAQLDSVLFEGRADQVAATVAAGDLGVALAQATQALALWRGRPYAPFSDEVWAAPAVARLEEVFAQLRERYVGVLIATGDPQRALVELRSDIANRPLREQLWALRMSADYRLGRVDEALSSYAQARRLFVQELGTEPTQALRDLQGRILAGDPVDPLGARRPRADGDRPTMRTSRLPPLRGRLIGRAAMVGRLEETIRRSRLVTLVGPPGSGKTRLALDVARDLAPQFPDGVIWADLTSAEDGDQVVNVVTSALGLTSPSVDGPLAALRRHASDRQLLLVLDNCEQALDPVVTTIDALFEDGGPIRVLATSREPLAWAEEVVCDVPPLATEPQTPGHQAPAVELFLERLTSTTTVSEADLELAARICAAVDGLPLAVELAAARSRAYSIAEIAVDVAEDPGSLSRVGRGAADHHRTLRYAVEQSYRAFTTDEAALHRAVSVLPGPFTAAVAADVLDRPTVETSGLVAGLVHRSMLVPLGPLEAGRPSRFSQLATVRSHAVHAARSERDRLTRRRDEWVERLFAGRPRMGRSAEAGWMNAVDDDLAAVRAFLQDHLVERPSARGIRVASALAMYWYYRGMVVEGIHWATRAVAAADIAEPTEWVMANLVLASSRSAAGRADLVRQQIISALDAVPSTPRDRVIPVAETLAVLLSSVSLANERGLLEAVAAELATVALKSEDPRLVLFADLGSMLVAYRGGEDGASVGARAGALWERSMVLDDHFSGRLSAGVSGLVAVADGRASDALMWSDRQIATHVALGLTEGPLVLEHRANVMTMTGDHVAALRLFAAARAHHRRAGLPWPQQPWTLSTLERASAMTPPSVAARAEREGAVLTLADIHQAG